MADTKDTALAAQTGTAVAGGDVFRTVDISDTSMAGSGTSKSISATELATAMSILAQYFAPIGLTGATAASRYVGSTSTGAAPTTGTFIAGDWITTILSTTATILVCTTGGAAGSCVWTNIANINRLAFDTLWAAKGDLVIGTGNDAASILPVSTVAGQTPQADPGATNLISYGNPLSASDAKSGVIGRLVSSYNRLWVPASATAFTPTGATLYLFAIPLPKGLTITTVKFWAGTTAGATLTHSWSAVYDSTSLAQLALSADVTTAAWAASTVRTFTMGTPYLTPSLANYYIALCVVGTTIPTIEAATGLLATGARNTATKAGGATTDTGLTTPASGPSTAGAVTTGTAFPYFEIA